MNYTVTEQPTLTLLEWELIKYHLRLTADDTEAGSGDAMTERTYVEGLRDAAINFAEEKMATSLLDQEITATFYSEDVAPVSQYQLTVPLTPLTTFPSRTSCLVLPRGPVSEITAVTDGNDDPITDYSLETIGVSDRLRLSIASVVFPVTVIYRAGVASPDLVPGMIRHAILQHIGTLYENRESVNEKSMIPVPHSLSDFYRLRSRNVGIG